MCPSHNHVIARGFILRSVIHNKDRTCMATIKLKFRPSTVRGKAGTLCYQLCHRQENRQITTDMRIFPEWWDETRRRLVTLPGNEEIITGYHKRTEREMRIVREIIRELDCGGEAYTLSEIINRYRSLPPEPCFLDYLGKEAGRLRENARYGTARNYRRAMESLSTFLNDKDIPFSALDSALVRRYEAWLRGRKVDRNSCSFYMRVLRAAYNKGVREGLATQDFPFGGVYTGVARNAPWMGRLSSRCNGWTCRSRPPSHSQGTCSCSATAPGE